MNVIDQNSAAAALEKALIPGPSLIDGRSEKERLSFLCEFASLINFYDNTNRLNGNWQPFLLKDPVFLLASISKTDYREEHQLFVKTCANLQALIDKQNSVTPTVTDSGIPGEITRLFNQLFDQLTRIFLQIESWTHYMQMGNEEYDLKKYVIDQVKETFNAYLWAVLSLRNFLSSTPVLEPQSIRQVLPVRQYVLDAFTDLIWTKGAGTDPFMQVLGLYSINEVKKIKTGDESGSSGPVPQGIVITTQDYFNGLKNTGDQLFKFYRTIIHHAATEYEKVKNIKSSYPDTLLLRTFTDLLRIHQQELNGIANKHLHFYYSRVLKQSEQAAVADSVFITAVLGKNVTVFDLPAGTLFNAGTDAQKNPILFVSNENVSLNAAVITNVLTLAPLTPVISSNPDGGEDNPPQLFLQNIATPGVVATNEAGQALSWETFGGTTNMDTTPAQVKQPGFAFASPMLFLPEGSRQIIIEFRFAELPDPTIFNNAQIFLSTQKAWQQVAYTILPNNREEKNISIRVNLAVTDPPIVSFLANPDGLNSSWPMFKVIFNSFSGLTIPPVLTSIKIDVCVTGVNTFALYNDNGLLSTKTPFQLFGPLVNMNSNFLVGSNEIFSKPLKWLSVELDWDTLPLPPASTVTPAPLDNGFGNYYNSYNTILFPTVTSLTPLTVQPDFSPQKKSSAKEPPSSAPPVTSAKIETEQPAKAPGKIRGFFKKVWNVIKWPVKIIFYPVRLLINAFSKKKDTPSLSPALQPAEKIAAAPPAFTPPAPPVPAQPVPFANIYFTVEFSMLNYHSWDTFYMYNYGGNTAYSAWLNNPCNTSPVLPDGKPIDFQLFDTSSGNLAAKSVFGYFASAYDTPADPDPSIQNTPLVFDGTNASGFIKMTLTNPANGFGASVYANVVTNIVTQNALKISGSWLLNPVKPSDLVTAPNVPFVPKVQTISAMYGASQDYDLTKACENYPLQYFYYTPFANYTAYDNSPALEKNYSADKSVVGECPEIKGLQLVPSFACNAKTGKEKIFPCSGAMFIGLSGVVPLNTISFFFELSTTYTAPTAGAEVSYYYLSDKGWKILPLENDGTNQFTCSGIITVNIPADITAQSAAMPAGYWIAIAAAIDPASGTMLDLSSFAQVVLLSPNGIELTRTGTAFLTDTVAPLISALTITKPQTAIPQIGTIVQPFSSFGGKAAENKMQMYERVSNRLKTKDRTVSGNDIFTLIRQQFPDIYFSGAVFSPDTNITSVYVVEGFDNSAAANAYRPFVSECEIEAISSFLKERISLFSNITVSNYSFQYIQVVATVSVKPGYVPQAMNGIIADALNIYFSPWIASAGQQQVMIGQPVTGSQVAAFIRGIEGVESVGQIQLLLSGQPLTAAVQTLNPPPGALFVSSLNHQINAIPVK